MEKRFIKLDYTAKLPDGSIFDTTDPAVAKAAGIDESRVNGPITICIGERMVVNGLDAKLATATIGKHTYTIPDAFGKKSAKLLKLYPMRQFKGQEIQPMPGMELNIDGKYGIVRSAAGGRVIVDFNHPLSSKEITYEVNILEEVTDLQTQVESILTMAGIPFNKITVEKKHVIIHVAEAMPKPIMDLLHKQITTITVADKLSFETGSRSETKKAD